MTYQQHPMSAVFPRMADSDFLALKDSIEIIGIQNPITLYEGMVLDGWHRYQASQELGLECPAQQLSPDTDPHDFVKAQNKERRHLSAGAWALIEAELWEWMAPHRPSQVKGAPGAPLARKVADMAAGAGVSERTMQQAGKVKTDAIPEIKVAVKAGEISLRAAHAVTELPPAEQKKLVEKGSAAIKEVAQKKRNEGKAVVSTEMPAAPAPERIGPSDDEIAALAAAEDADRAFLAKLLDADDKLAAAHAEITRLNALTAGLQQRVNGLLNEKAEAIKAAKRERNRADRLQKRLESLEGATA